MGRRTGISCVLVCAILVAQQVVLVCSYAREASSQAWWPQGGLVLPGALQSLPIWCSEEVQQGLLTL